MSVVYGVNGTFANQFRQEYAFSMMFPGVDDAWRKKSRRRLADGRRTGYNTIKKPIRKMEDRRHDRIPSKTLNPIDFKRDWEETDGQA